MTTQTKQRLLSWLKIGGITLGASVLILLWRQIFTLAGYADALLVPGIVLLFVLLLKILANYGAFDLVAYTVARIFRGSRANTLKDEKDAHEFVEGKRLERSRNQVYYLPYIVISVVFIGVGALLSFLFIESITHTPSEVSGLLNVFIWYI